MKNEISRSLGRELVYVGVKDEARLTLKGLVAATELPNVVLIDVGSGNTKAVYYKTQDGRGFADTVRLADGVRVVSKKADPTRPEQEYVKELKTIKEREIAPNLRLVVNDNPAFANRTVLYLTGGICWVMSSALAPPDARIGEGKDRLELKADQIAGWLKKVQANPRSAYDYPAENVKPGAEQIARDNQTSIQSNFSPTQILAGATILQALQEEMNFAGRQKIVFCRDSLYAWPRAYVSEVLAKKGI